MFSKRALGRYANPPKLLTRLKDIGNYPPELLNFIKARCSMLQPSDSYTKLEFYRAKTKFRLP